MVDGFFKKMNYSHLWVLGIVFTISIVLLIWALFYLNLLSLGILLFPAFVANSLAFLSSKINFLNFLAIPIDMNKKWLDGRRIIGKGKTLRGYVVGVLGAVLVAIVIFELSEMVNFPIYSSVREAINLGFLLGLGALVGDSVKSFFKRRLGKNVGESWFPFDQLDFLLGALGFIWFFKTIPILLILILIPSTILTHSVSNIFSFYIKIKKVPW